MTDAIDIICKLKRLGKTQKQIACELGVTSGVVGNVIHSRVTAFEVANYIATLLNSEINDLWPDRYVFKPRGASIQRKQNQK